jgi:hypothetical protein
LLAFSATNELDFFDLDDVRVLSLASPVPEPITWAMTILGFAGVGFMTYRRRKTAALAA